MHRNSWIFLTIILLLSAAAGCTQSLNQWEGSIDAVFKYRASESITLVHEIRPDTFAEEAGLKPGDLLVAIDKKSLTGATFQEVREGLRGPVGTTVVLTVQRGETIMDIPIERRPVAKN